MAERNVSPSIQAALQSLALDLKEARASNATLRRALELFLDAHGWGNVTACACECCMAGRAALAATEKGEGEAASG